MQVLVTLAEAGGKVVSRDRLFSRCWGNVPVGEDSLNRAIGEIRRVARTAGDGSFSIDTIPRTGYRLVSEEAMPSTGSIPRRLLVVGGAISAATIAIAAFWRTDRDTARQEADRLVAQGERALRRGTAADNARGATLLSRAATLQPERSDILGQLALAWAHVAEYASPDQVAEVRDAAEDAAERALAIDSKQPDALSALAVLPPYFGDWLAAERRMLSVMRIAPDHLPTRDAYAFFRVAVGRARAGANDRIAFAGREPMHATHQHKLIYSYWIVGDIGNADRCADRALQLFPWHLGIWFARLWTLAFTGRPLRALAHIADAASRPPLPDWMIETLSRAMQAMATLAPADVDATTARVLDEVSRGPSNAVNAVLILAGLGEIDRAFGVANAYLLERGPLMASVRWSPGDVSITDQRRRKTNMLFVPATAAMRGDSRFEELVKAVGLADYWRRSGSPPDFLMERRPPTS